MPWLKELQSRFFKNAFFQANWANPLQHQRRHGSELSRERQIDELIGLIKGVMADGSVQQREGEFLLQWLDTHKDALDQWPAQAIYPRLKSALSDGNLDSGEEHGIRTLLATVISHDPATAHASRLIEIPFTQPVPDIQFVNRLFCLTGHLQSGSRSWCTSQILARGGISTSKIDRKLHYLIVGDMGGDWFHAQQGQKIVHAIRHIELGANIAILRERHWFEQLQRSQV